MSKPDPVTAHAHDVPDHADTAPPHVFGLMAEFDTPEVAIDPVVLAAAVRERPDVCLLDIRMPGNGIAAAWEIHSRLPLTKIVMLTVSQQDADLFAALRAGASGYVLKEMNPSRLPRVVLAVVGGEAAVPRALVGRIVDQFRDPGALRRPSAAKGTGALLTSREREVLMLVVDGKASQVIARELNISVKTVDVHRTKIKEKMGVTSIGMLVREVLYP